MRLIDVQSSRLEAAMFGAANRLGSLADVIEDEVPIRPVVERPKVAALLKWRLRRIIEFVDGHLTEPVTLANMAAVTGLSAMHFAAQFRVAMGVRPHEYLLRRRVERAQELLVGGEASVVDIALSVGFQTQAHFTSVFKRFIGQPPHAWRQWYWNGAQ